MPYLPVWLMKALLDKCPIAVWLIFLTALPSPFLQNEFLINENMKVRIADNKIRFRLKEPEVKRLQLKGSITEVLEFGVDPGDRISFTIAESDTDTISVQLKNNEITVGVPKTKLTEWTSTELVGFDAAVDTNKGKIIDLLVEKDFMCMDGREEENEGSYPNPLANR
jgi:hypothetical protein